MNLLSPLYKNKTKNLDAETGSLFKFSRQVMEFISLFLTFHTSKKFVQNIIWRVKRDEKLLYLNWILFV